MKKNAYPLHPDFSKFAKVSMPKSRLSLWIANCFVGLLYRFWKIPKHIAFTRTHVSTRDGYRLPVDIFRGQGISENKEAVVYFPGGGFIMKPTHFHKQRMFDFVEQANVTVCVVHYRLAPKYPFPTAFFDAVDAYLALSNHATALGIDKTKIGVAGDSAGGNLAAALSLYLRDHQETPAWMEMLLYPGLDYGYSSESRKAFGDTPMFSNKHFPMIERYYYRNGFVGLEHYAIPLRHPNHANLPPTYIETAEFDPLRDDGQRYATVLKENGVIVEYHPTKGTMHGYDVVKKNEIVQICMEKRLQFLKSQK